MWDDSTNINELVDAVRSVYLDGLDPLHYNIEYFNENGAEDFDSARYDVALTRTFFELAHDLYEGRVKPSQLFPDSWETESQSVDYPGLLESALNGAGVCNSLDLLRPMDNAYDGLKYMLARFVDIKLKGGLPLIKQGSVISLGVRDERIADIRHILSSMRYLPAELDNGDILYDSLMQSAMIGFQMSHNLTPDGILGKRTQEILNLSADAYIEKIKVNLERYRWLQSRLLGHCIHVNIPTFELNVLSSDRSELDMRVIVGRRTRKTPVLSSEVRSILLNPTWTVPPTILKEDVLPAVKLDPSYLDRHQMKIIDRNGVVVNVDSIEWAEFHYQVREDAGPDNPLGRIKFNFPNRHAVYMHDTNSPSLFSLPDRALSSGCIRVEKPMSLLRFLLPDTGWSDNDVIEQIATGKTRLISVKNPLPVHITYFTAYVSGNEFYIANDIYGYDKVVSEALNRR